MAGILKGDCVALTQKEGAPFYSRGNYGYPQSGGSFEMDLIEATYLVECDRLEVLSDEKKMTFEEIFCHSSSVLDDFDIKYIVYRDIRQRGCIVRNECGEYDMTMYERGKNISNSRPQYYVRAVSERTSTNISSFKDQIQETQNRGKQLLYAVVDEEGDLGYYAMSKVNSRGKVPAEIIGTAEGRLVRDRVFVFEPESCELLNSKAFYGKMISGVLQLSIIEACYLMHIGALTVSGPDGRMDKSSLKEYGRAVQEEFDMRLSAYTDLRGRGLVVKAGFKYGTHFRVYEESPDDCHARYLIHSVLASTITMWPEISRIVRLSMGVKKDILFCRVTDRMEYLIFKWVRP